MNSKRIYPRNGTDYNGGRLGDIYNKYINLLAAKGEKQKNTEIYTMGGD